MFVQGDGTGECQPVFSILLQAELVPATVNDYREKLLHLRKLRCDIVQPTIPSGSLQEVRIHCEKAVVTFLYSESVLIPSHGLQSF